MIDERELTRRVNDRDVELTVDEFGARELEAEDLDATMVIKTSETSEVRARELLELSEAALLRVLGGGDDLKVDVSLLTHQTQNRAAIRLGDAAPSLALRGLGVHSIDPTIGVDFVVNKLVTEYHCLLLRFYRTDFITNPQLEIELADGRTVMAQRRAYR